jgi:hypothetical protein
MCQILRFHGAKFFRNLEKGCHGVTKLVKNRKRSSDAAGKISDEFKNTNGGRFEKDMQKEITVFEPVAVPLHPNAGSEQYSTVNLVEKKIKVKGNIYHPNSEKAVAHSLAMCAHSLAGYLYLF